MNYGTQRRHSPPQRLKTYRVDNSTLRKLLMLELLHRGQVADLCAASKIVFPLSESVLLTWLKELGYCTDYGY
jgi:hypothetical protein